MKYFYKFIFLITFFPLVMQAQTFSLYYEFDTLMSSPCPGNNGSQVHAIRYVEVYQTMDNTWNGPKDPNVCINVNIVNNKPAIDLYEADLSKSIFLRLNLPNNAKILLPENQVGRQTLQWSVSPGVSFVLGDTCTEGLCTGAWVGIEVPDSAGTGTVMRRYDEMLTYNSTYSEMQACIPTEKFPSGNYFKELIWKFTVQNANGISNYVFLDYYQQNLYAPDTMGWGGMNGEYVPLTDTIVPHTANVHHYSASLANLYNAFSGFGIFLTLYEDNTYPSGNAISYVEFNPSPASLVQDTIDISLYPDQTLVFQPFTSIRGGFVFGDTTRHIVNFVNNGGDLCFPGFMEVNMHDRVNYIHKQGHLSFGGKMACLMFWKGSGLTVAEGATLQYGVNGKGMMGWRTGATLTLEKNATLIFDGIMVLLEYKTDIARNDVAITLPPGSKLVFTEAANILNFCTFGRKVKIYMKGGTLEMDKLSAEAKQHIEVIYDEKPQSIEDNIVLMGNPVFDKLEWQYIDDVEGSINLSCWDAKGAKLFTQNYTTQKGINALTTDFSHLLTGMYYVRFENAEGNITRKILVLK